MTLEDKVAHVKAARQTRQHHCHWPGCQAQVPPAKWGCTRHWFMLPRVLRRLIWRTYQPGQEQTRTPSAAYVAAARKVQEWIEDQPKRQPASGGDNQGSLL